MVTTNPEMLCTLCFFILLEPRKYKKIRLTGLSYVTWWLCLSDTILCLYSPLCFASLLLAQKHQTIIQLFLTSSSVNLNCSVKQKKNLPLSFLIPLSTTAGHKMSHANGWKSLITSYPSRAKSYLFYLLITSQIYPLLSSSTAIILIPNSITSPLGKYCTFLGGLLNSTLAFLQLLPPNWLFKM